MNPIEWIYLVVGVIVLLLLQWGGLIIFLGLVAASLLSRAGYERFAPAVVILSLIAGILVAEYFEKRKPPYPPE